jgi:hypothetical protein
MTRPEFLCWTEYFRLYPFDDLHRYHRPAASIASAWGGKYEERIEFLAPEAIPAGYTKADWVTMKTFGIKPKVKG